MKETSTKASTHWFPNNWVERFNDLLENQPSADAITTSDELNENTHNTNTISSSSSSVHTSDLKNILSKYDNYIELTT